MAGAGAGNAARVVSVKHPDQQSHRHQACHAQASPSGVRRMDNRQAATRTTIPGRANRWWAPAGTSESGAKEANRPQATSRSRRKISGHQTRPARSEVAAAASIGEGTYIDFRTHVKQQLPLERVLVHLGLSAAVAAQLSATPLRHSYSTAGMGGAAISA